MSDRATAPSSTPEAAVRDEILLPVRSQYTPAEMEAIGPAWRLWLFILRGNSWEHGNGWYQVQDVAAELQTQPRSISRWLARLAGQNPLRRRFISISHHGTRRRALITLSTRELKRIQAAREVMRHGGRPRSLQPVEAPAAPPALVTLPVTRRGADVFPQLGASLREQMSAPNYQTYIDGSAAWLDGQRLHWESPNRFTADVVQARFRPLLVHAATAAGLDVAEIDVHVRGS